MQALVHFPLTTVSAICLGLPQGLFKAHIQLTGLAPQSITHCHTLHLQAYAWKYHAAIPAEVAEGQHTAVSGTHLPKGVRGRMLQHLHTGAQHQVHHAKLVASHTRTPTQHAKCNQAPHSNAQRGLVPAGGSLLVCTPHLNTYKARSCALHLTVPPPPLLHQPAPSPASWQRLQRQRCPSPSAAASPQG